MKIVIQIYEVQHPSEAEQLIRIGVDTIGSVVTSPQEWKVPHIYDTIRLTESLGAQASLIPLFSELDRILTTIDYYRPHIIHFCESLPTDGGDLSAWRRVMKMQETVKKRFPEIKIMRSIPIRASASRQDSASMEIARLFEPISDLFLTDTLLDVDTGAVDSGQPVNGFVGITGKICDWDIAETLVNHSRIPVILGGGISPENVRKGIQSVRPAGIDSCTQTNAQDAEGRVIRFKKDLDKVQRLVREVRSAENFL